MPFTNMSDGRGFTDYRSQKEQMNFYENQFNAHDSKTIRFSMIQNAESIQNTQACTPKQASGMSVLCGGPMAQYVSTKSTVTEFPKGPLTQ